MAHERRSRSAAIRAEVSPVGVSIALQDEQVVCPNSRRDRKWAEVYGPWLEATGRGNFLGVKVHSKPRLKENDLGPEPGVELTQIGN